MLTYNYKVKDAKGKTIKGVIEAANEKQAAIVLRDQNFLIMEISAKSEGFSGLNRIFSKVGDNETIEFTRQLSTMINAGLPLTEALVILRDQTKNAEMAQIIDKLLGEVQGGSSLASALEKYPKIFPKIYVALIRAGETAGVLDKVCQRLADNLERNREFKSKTKGAMIYPIIVTLVMIVVIAVMMIFVFPKLTSMYKDFNVALPLPTKILMSVSDFSVKFAPLIVIVLIVLVFLFQNFSRTEKGKLFLDKLIFKIPLVGALQKEIALTEFSRTLGLLMSTGIPIIDALNIVSETVDNMVYQNAIKQAAIEVGQGVALAVPISHDPNFPPIVSQMIKVGEESGKMDEVLDKLSHYFESQSEHLVKGLTTAIEPLIMVVLGISVAFIIISVLLPIYSLTSQF